MREFNPQDLKKLYIPKGTTHKGQNGKLLIVGGSHLFHGASLWALKVASRIVDMVFYASVEENNGLTQKLKSEIYDFIAIPRDRIGDYIKEADVILIGPGMPRKEGRIFGEQSTKELVESMIKDYAALNKKWVIDAGALTEISPQLIICLNGNIVVTPHGNEFKVFFGADPNREKVSEMAKKYNCVILLKGAEDIIASATDEVVVIGGNPGMTKGGTGDVLAGLVAGLSCKNDLFLAASSASFINKKTGDELFKKVGPYFNSSDLVDEIPKVMKDLLF